MVFYLLLFIYFFSALFGRKEYKSITSKRIAVIIYILPLFLLTALRDVSIGPDTSAYYRIFYLIANRDSFMQAFAYSHFEPGYVLLNYIIGKMGGSYYFMQIIISAFIYYSFGKFIFQYSDHIAFSCFLLLANNCVFGTMNVVRMWIVVAILLFEIKPIQQRRLVTCIIITAIAASFHYTALLFLLMYPLAKKIVSIDKIGTMFIIAVAISIAAIPVFTFITNAIGLYQNYLTGTRFDTSDNVAVKISLVVNMCFLGLATVTHAWENSRDEIIENNQSSPVSISMISYWGIILSVCISIIGLSNNIMGRIIYYFSIFELLSIPHSIKNMRLTNNMIITTFVILSLLALKMVIILVYRPIWYQVVPYKLFFI